MVNAARRVADGQLALMYADIQRNSYYTEEAERRDPARPPLAPAALEVRVQQRRREPRHRAEVGRARRHARGLARAGVAEFYRIHHFPLPGAHRGIGEVGAQHDFVHVLADYPPTPEGEIDVFAFIAVGDDRPEGLRPARHDARAVPELDDHPRGREEGRDRARRDARGPRRARALRRRAAPRRRSARSTRSASTTSRSRTNRSTLSATQLRDPATRGPQSARCARPHLSRPARTYATGEQADRGEEQVREPQRVARTLGRTHRAPDASSAANNAPNAGQPDERTDLAHLVDHPGLEPGGTGRRRRPRRCSRR